MRNKAERGTERHHLLGPGAGHRLLARPSGHWGRALLLFSVLVSAGGVIFHMKMLEEWSSNLSLREKE